MQYQTLLKGDIGKKFSMMLFMRLRDTFNMKNPKINGNLMYINKIYMIW